MSLTNYVPEKGRVYVRKFDHEEATRRRAAGEGVTQLAAEYGVTANAIYLATDSGQRQRVTERRTRFVEVEGQLQARCSTCREVKPLDEFPGAPAFRDVRPNGVHNTCRSCHTEIKRRYRAAHPDYNARQNAARLRKYHERRRNGEAVFPHKEKDES